MKELFIGLLKHLKTLLIVFLIISVIVVIISMILKFMLSDVFYYASMISFIIAYMAISGNMKMSGNSYYIHAQSVTSSSMHESAKENMRLRDSSFGFLIFMTIIGILLMITSNILSRFGQ